MFAVMFQDGTYLNRKANHTWSTERRSRVEWLDDATLWAKRGHAKSALRAAVENNELPVGIEAAIVEVMPIHVTNSEEWVRVARQQHRLKVEKL